MSEDFLIFGNDLGSHLVHLANWATWGERGVIKDLQRIRNKKKRDTDAARQGAGTERDPHRHPYKHRKRPTYLKSAREKPKGLRPGV